MTPDLIGALARGSEPLLIAFIRADFVGTAVREQLTGMRERVQTQRRKLLAIAGDGNNVAAQDASAVLSDAFFSRLAGPGFESAAQALVSDWQKNRRGHLSVYARRLLVGNLLALVKQQMVREHARTLGLDGADVEHLHGVLEKEGIVLERALPLVDRAENPIRSVEDIARLAETHPGLVIGDLETAISGNALRFWLREVASPSQLVDAQVQAVKWVQNVQADIRMSAAAREQLLKLTLHRAVWHVIWAAGYHFLELGDLSREGPRVRLSSLEQLTGLVDGRIRGEAIDGRAIYDSSQFGGLEALSQAIVSRRLSGWLRHLRADASIIEAAEDLERELPAMGNSAGVVRLAFHRLAWSLGLKWLELPGFGRLLGRAGIAMVDADAKASTTAMKEGLIEAFVREALGQAKKVDAARAAAQGGSEATVLRILQWKLGRRSVTFKQVSFSEPVLVSIVESATQSEAVLAKFGEAVIEDVIPRWLQHTEGPLTGHARALRQMATRNAPTDTALRVLRHLGMDSYPVFPADRPTDGPVAHLAGRSELCAQAASLRTHLDLKARLTSLQEFVAPRFRGPEPDGLLEVLWRAGDSTLRDASCEPITRPDGSRLGGLDVSGEVARQAFVDWLEGHKSVPVRVQKAVHSGVLSRWLGFHDPVRAASLAGALKAPDAGARELAVTLAAFGCSRLVVDPRLVEHRVPELKSHGTTGPSDAEGPSSREGRCPGDGQAAHGGPGESTGVLSVLRGPDKGKRFMLSNRVMHLGRGLECELVLNDASASRKHFRIENVAGRFNLVDLGSVNGTLIGGTRPDQAVLKQDDLVEVGSTLLHFGYAGCPDPTVTGNAGPGDGSCGWPKAVLSVLRGPDEGKWFILPDGVVNVGRDSRCGVVLKDPLASRHHFRVEREAGRFVLFDLEGKNGTRVRGTVVKRAVLTQDDEILVGSTLLHFGYAVTPGSPAIGSAAEGGGRPTRGDLKVKRTALADRSERIRSPSARRRMMAVLATVFAAVVFFVGHALGLWQLWTIAGAVPATFDQRTSAPDEENADSTDTFRSPLRANLDRGTRVRPRRPPTNEPRSVLDSEQDRSDQSDLPWLMRRFPSVVGA